VVTLYNTAADYNWPFYTSSSSATTTGSTKNYLVWQAWANHYPATTIGTGHGYAAQVTNGSITQYVWTGWNEQHEHLAELRQVTDVQTLQKYTRRKMTDVELKAALEQEKKWREEAEARAKKAEDAKKRADDLLRTFLSAEQREDLDKKNCFYIVVDGKDGKKERYRIDKGSHGNVKQVDDRGSIIRSFCIQPDGVPNGDVLLTQKLWLEASEETREEFWATANITTLMHEKTIPSNIPRKERRKYAEANGLLH
jgi:hypothetical protein